MEKKNNGNSTERDITDAKNRSSDNKKHIRSDAR
jgi:hypothetical protein